MENRLWTEKAPIDRFDSTTPIIHHAHDSKKRETDCRVFDQVSIVMPVA
jgi:hypothetical protein